jgi:hypothetical protein
MNRAKKMVSLIKQGKFDRLTMLQEDDPNIFRAILVNEVKSDGFIDMPQEQQAKVIEMIELYQRQIALAQMKEQQMMMEQMQMQAAIMGGPQGQGQG